MGQAQKTGRHSPLPRQKAGKAIYFYGHAGTPRKEESLGKDYGIAIRRWAEIDNASMEKSREIITFRYAAEKYLALVIPTKPPPPPPRASISVK